MIVSFNPDYVLCKIQIRPKKQYLLDRSYIGILHDGLNSIHTSVLFFTTKDLHSTFTETNHPYSFRILLVRSIIHSAFSHESLLYRWISREDVSAIPTILTSSGLVWKLSKMSRPILQRHILTYSLS